ncbi:LacI family DNA-binding transcriptional regulator [Cellulomonas sp. ATA003]|uniref:LacI family DNA-binding transcriptional regulator n=1 Tax=Cellulomonas sp. ATA003 TaxID=3073064 RepID=UPI0028732913|nr:LacI family DNA-binding transcriptional regulator [Cellulomonas sp. ATA003]WNB87151.1 LacI family DNA-binding transcriptional regulator [Cellulomonas sp. ATA003]
MSATMRDVARRAEVSVKTVSNVVNQFPHVRPATRERVLAAIDELGYQMNFTARSLSLGRTGMITLAIPKLRLPYFAELADEVIGAAEARGYTVLVEQTGGSREREIELLASDRRRMTDGLILSPFGLRSGDGPRLETGFPVVLLGERSLHARVHHVVMANTAGTRAVTEHLLAIGRRRIALVGSYEPGAEGAGYLRTQGYLEALAAAGLERDPARTAPIEDWTMAGGADAMRALLARGVEFDAVLGLNDVLALGAMRALFEHGLSVPDDVAVAGFDDIEEAGFSRPSLTTVRPDRAQIARHAVALLTERIVGAGPEPASPDREAPYVADYVLRVRESTGPRA